MTRILILLCIASITMTSCKPKGCTAECASNHDENAKKDDGSCQGCTDPVAPNYCPEATTDDDSCIKRIFTTKSTFSGNLMQYCTTASTGIEAADCLCDNAAQAANLGGTWKAWISSSTTNAIDRITDVGPWYLVDGITKVFNNKTNLTTAPLVPINMDENGGLITWGVWTGTSAGGTKDQFLCNDWSLGTGNGRFGDAVKSDNGWTASAVGPCGGNQFGLYCIEQ